MWYNKTAFLWARLILRALVSTALALFLTACGTNQDQVYEIQGELKTCTVIDTQPCGLTLACQDDGFYQCVSN